jgi:adenylate cyclase
MKVVGIYRPGAINTIVPELRDEVARRLGGATKGWNAVAIGASGRVGIKLGAESEQVAVDGSMENCVRQDRDCRVAVVGPFLVERLR